MALKIDKYSFQQFLSLQHGNDHHQNKVMIDKESMARWVKAWKAWIRLSPEKKKRAWAKANQHRRIAYDHARRARKKGNPKGDSRAITSFIRSVRSAEDVVCYWCNQPIMGKRHIDHIVPIARGGADDVHNLCASCHACNESKSDWLPHEWNKQMVFTFVPYSTEESTQHIDKETTTHERKRSEFISKTSRDHLIPVCQGDIAFVPLTKQRYALIDKESWDMVKMHRWSCTPNGHARTSIGKRNILLGRFIMGKHYRRKHGNRLDYRKSSFEVLGHSVEEQCRTIWGPPTEHLVCGTE